MNQSTSVRYGVGRVSLTLALILFTVASHDLVAQELTAEEASGVATRGEPTRESPFVERVTEDMKRLSPDAQLWINTNTSELYVLGQVSCRAGALEMFACPRGTKEYESVVAVDSSAQLVHTGLLAIGAKPGSPMQFDPKYLPAQGPIIDVTVEWFDSAGNMHSDRAQEWVRHAPTGKALEHNWVFAGSGFWEDPESGERFYRAEGGELICVSNFSTATIDLPIASTQDNANLIFEAFTEHIPALGTPVRLILRPRSMPRDDSE